MKMYLFGFTFILFLIKWKIDMTFVSYLHVIQHGYCIISRDSFLLMMFMPTSADPAWPCSPSSTLMHVPTQRGPKAAHVSIHTMSHWNVPVVSIGGGFG